VRRVAESAGKHQTQFPDWSRSLAVLTVLRLIVEKPRPCAVKRTGVRSNAQFSAAGKYGTVGRRWKNDCINARDA